MHVLLRLLGRIKANFYTIGMLSFSLIVLSSVVIHLIESETFPTIFEGFWWVMTTVTTVGYGDYYPKSVEGRIFGVLLYIFGIGLISVVIGNVISLFGTYHRLKEEGKLKYKGKDHVVLLGWSNKTKKVIDEVLHSTERDIVLIEKLEKSPIKGDRIHYIQGDPTDYETFDYANLIESDSVLILAPPQIDDAVLADGHTLLIASSIESYGTLHKREIYTVVEILKHTHKKNFIHAKVDDFILSEDSVSHLMAKSSIQKGSSRIFEQLLSSQDNEDIWEISRKKEWITYKDADDYLSSQGANLIADGKDLSITRKLNQKMPDKAKLIVLYDKDTFEKIK
ncbi:voltage-gated potassium channel [Peribacillus deserti]|uniref:Voltage-gated potassium channel n=2 Tax=Peribacillus deserti TaxID=673318 RepID=A0ABS2QFM2_9BACI|nr:potassium channel family protein [Peribacillus deserti]MBM7691948.1 voltage-gated potassium channel [Peribacillus deserti]